MPRWSTDLYSILGEWQWNINDKWTTFAGGRIDKHTFTDEMYSPRAAVVYSPTDIDTLKADVVAVGAGKLLKKK